MRKTVDEILLRLTQHLALFYIVYFLVVLLFGERKYRPNSPEEISLFITSVCALPLASVNLKVLREEK